MNSLKKALFALSLIAPAGMFAMNININESVQKAKDFADQIRVSNDLAATAENIKNMAAIKLEMLPDELLGINIESLKRGEVNPENLKMVQRAIDRATEKLPLVITSLQYPDFVLDGLNSILNTSRIKALAAGDTLKLSLLATLRYAVDFGMKHKDAVNVVSQRLAILLEELNARLEGLKGKDLSTLKVSELAKKFGALKEDFEKEYVIALPLIRGFIEANKESLKNILAQIKDLNITIDVQGLLEAIQNELNKQDELNKQGF